MEELSSQFKIANYWDDRILPNFTATLIVLSSPLTVE